MTLPAARSIVSALTATGSTSSRPLPVGAVRLHGGVLRDRQVVNREASLARGLEQLRASGNLQNFRNLVEGTGQHGHEEAVDGDVKNFVDSDVYKWLEAVAWESARGPLGAEIEDAAEEAITLIAAAQDADGYLNTWYQTQDRSTRFSNLAFGHEMYCLGHLLQAAVAFARVRGDRRLLDVGRRFADLVVARFGADGEVAVCGHPEIEMALVELARETGDLTYAEQARLFVDRRGHGLLGEGRFGAAYYQDRVPFRQLDTVEGHAVRAVYLGAGAVDCAVELGDDDLLAAASRQWSAMVATKMYVTGGIGSRHHGESFGDAFELPSDGAYCESCAAIGVMMWSWRLLLAGRDRDVADVLERSLYNGVLVGVSRDGRAFNYVNPLHVRTEHPRQEWFEIACCPPNLMRTFASLEHYVASEDDEAVHLHLLAPADVDAGAGRRFTVRTSYPAAGDVRIQIDGSADAPWTLNVRVPRWAEGHVRVQVNGADRAVTIDPTGYLSLEGPWAEGDVVDLQFPVAPRLTMGDPAIDASRGAVAVERGPLVYCLEAGASSLDPDDVVVDTDQPLADEVEQPDALPSVRVAARLSQPSGADWPYLPYSEAETTGGRADMQTRLVPYFLWGNGRPGPMRVWLRTV